MVVDLAPKTCRTSRDCGMQYRLGGCCSRSRVVGGQENMNAEAKQYFEMQSGELGLCAMGSGVEAVEKLGPQVNTFDYSRYMWDSDPMVRATWGMIDPE